MCRNRVVPHRHSHCGQVPSIHANQRRIFDLGGREEFVRIGRRKCIKVIRRRNGSAFSVGMYLNIQFRFLSSLLTGLPAFCHRKWCTPFERKKTTIENFKAEVYFEYLSQLARNMKM